MLKNYFRIAWRNLLKNRTSSTINIVGLAIGLAIALLISLWINDEMTFNHYHTRHSRLAQAMIAQKVDGKEYIGTTVMIPLGNAIADQYKHLFKNVSLISESGQQLIGYGDKRISAGAIWAQPAFADMFTLKFIKGSASAASDPSTALISSSLAIALFGKDADPIHKVIRIDNKYDLTIGGVYEDLPKNTSYHGTQLIKPWANSDNHYRNSNKNWEDHNSTLFVELADGVTAEKASAAIRNLPTPHISFLPEFALVEPMDRIYLYADYNVEKPDGGRIRFVRLFGIVGAFVLLLACINFMNLSTARSEKRAKEVGIRKTVGSLRSQLVAQFLSEAVLIALLSFILSIALVQLSLPFFNTLSAKSMSLPWNSWIFWLITLAFVLLTGVLAGSYPAFYLSRFDPVSVLKGTFKAGKSASTPRQVLVVLQFTVSLTLIIGTLVVYRQIRFAKDRPVGYSREGLLTIQMNTPELYDHYDALRQALIEKGVVENVAASSLSPTSFDNNNELEWRGKRTDQKSIFFRNVNITQDYGRTIGWRMVQGRDFGGPFLADSNNMIINEAAVKVMGMPDPIGEVVTFWGKQYTIVGVANDMLTNSPYDKIEPALFINQYNHATLIARIKPGLAAHEALAGIESVFKIYNPGNPFSYTFLDDAYAAKFETEQRIGDLASLFTSLAIFISCIGLFGLASFIAEQRTKEIGVRKVLGASIFNLWGLLSKDFLKLVALSFCIAMPLAGWAMHRWLEGYHFRTNISWWIFAASGAGLLLVTLLTVSFQSLRAATMNPSRSLRSE